MTIPESYKAVLKVFILSLSIFSCAIKETKDNVVRGEIKKTTVKALQSPRESSVEKIIMGPRNKKGQVYFVDKTDDYGLKGVKGTQLYAVDFDSDGHTDLVTIDSFFAEPQFYRFDKKKKKFSSLRHSPFKKMVRASYLSFVDLDKDGVLDLLLGTLNQKTELSQFPQRLFKGVLKKKGIFYEEKEVLFREIMPSSSTIFFDYNLDGHLDAFIANWYDYKKSGHKAVPDKLLKGERFSFFDTSYLLDGEYALFENRNEFANARPSFGASSCDVDRNGFLDIIVASSSGHPNKLWMNVLNRKKKSHLFKDYGVTSGLSADKDGRFNLTGGGNTFYGVCNDYNNDGIVDIALGEIFHSYDPESRDRSSILTGSRLDFPPKFIRTEYHMDDGTSTWSQGDRRASWIDLNNDGLDDLLIDNSGFPPKSRLLLFQQKANHAFVDRAYEMGVDVLNPSGTVTLDINRDGKMDFLVGQTDLREEKIKKRVYLFENSQDLANTRSFRFFLRGSRSNYHGLGSLVSLYFSKKVLEKEVRYSHGSMPSQNEEGIHFAIESSQIPQYVKVQWPILEKSGKRKIVKYELSQFVHKKHVELILYENGEKKER